jgi:polyphosphate kinase
MPRTLDRRIELLTPVEDPEARDRLIHILQTYFDDNVKSWTLQADGSYRRTPAKRRRQRRSQAELYAEACEAVREAEQSRQTTFEPHRAPGKD